MRESTATSTGMQSKHFAPCSWTGANVDGGDSVRIPLDAALAATLLALRKLITGSLVRMSALAACLMHQNMTNAGGEGLILLLD